MRYQCSSSADRAAHVQVGEQSMASAVAPRDDQRSRRPRRAPPLPARARRGLRSYSPLLGRWFSRDPIGEGPRGPLHCFNYNNPLLYIDPDGRAPQVIGIDVDGDAIYGPDQNWGDYDSLFGGRGCPLGPYSMLNVTIIYDGSFEARQYHDAIMRDRFSWRFWRGPYDWSIADYRDTWREGDGVFFTWYSEILRGDEFGNRNAGYNLTEAFGVLPAYGACCVAELATMVGDWNNWTFEGGCASVIDNCIGIGTSVLEGQHLISSPRDPPPPDMDVLKRPRGNASPAIPSAPSPYDGTVPVSP